MAKASKTTAVALVDDKSANVGAFAITAEVTNFAASLGIDLAGSRDDRADRAAEHMNRSQRHMLAAGLLLGSLKADCAHGEFGDLLAERGFEPRNAQKAMWYAQFVTSRPDAERQLLIGLPKSKVMALAGADDQVIEAVLAGDGEDSIDALSVRALQGRIRELEAQAVDTSVQLETTEAKLTAAEKKLAKGLPDREDHLPHVIADARFEIAALVKKAELAINSFNPLGVELVQLHGTDAAHDWADSTLRLAVSGLASLHLQLTGVLKKFMKELPGEDATPVDRSRLTQQEVVEVAQHWMVLTQAHDHEKAMRDWEAEQRAPKGKGRPKAAPKAKGGA